MRSIGIVTTNITDMHHARSAYIMEREFNKLGYSVMLCNTGDKTEESINYIKMLSERNIDGIILMGSVFNNKDIQSSISSYLSNIPTVLQNGSLDIENTYSVLVDDSYGISLCVDHLYEKGHSDIIYVKDKDTYSAVQKKDGFLVGMNKHGLKLDENSIINTQCGLEGGRDVIKKLIKLKKKFTAIIFGEDVTAIGADKRTSSHRY